MGQYVLRRLLAAIPVAVGVATIVFLITHLSGDPVDIMLGPSAPPEAREALRHQLGLDHPLPVQYVTWLANAAHGDLGKSIVTGQSVAAMTVSHFGPTLILTLAGLGISLAIGLPLGILAGIKRNSWID